MSLDVAEASIVVMSSSWCDESELSFVTRSVAGAASRSGAVSIFTPSPAGERRADGAFDLVGIGAAQNATWPDVVTAHWPHEADADAVWIVDEPSESALALLHGCPGRAAHSIAPVGLDTDPSVSQLRLIPRPDRSGAGLHVPINPLARTGRHTGLGFTGYLLVLTDRPSRPPVTPPTSKAAWLTARFPEQYVVVVEGAEAVVWKGRALRGAVPIDTRTDLWRLVAHAAMTVDLDPGAIVARECIESLRFGTPIVVPAHSVAARHAQAGGGLTFRNVEDMFEAVERLMSPQERECFSRDGAVYADSAFGDPDGFVAALAATLQLKHP